MCEQPRNGLTIIWRVQSIFRCHNCFGASEEFPEMRL